MGATFVLLLFAVVLLPGITESSVLCLEEEKDALLDFKLSFTADPNNLLSNWSIGNVECCEWRGVDCDTLTGHVVSLSLNDSLNSHELRPSLLVLHHLSSLSLINNDFSMRIPKFIGSLINLTFLSLANSGFYGEISPYLGNLTKLQTLNLRANSGLYSNNLQWVSHLPSLKELTLDDVNLSNVTVFKMLPSLSSLSCSYCSLPCAPPLSSMLNLTSIGISNNLINSLPDLSKLSLLTYFHASSNKLQGNLQAILQHLPTSLEELDLSANSLKDIVSDSHFVRFSNLTYLDLSENTLLEFNFTKNWIPPSQLGTLILRSCKVGPQFPNWTLKLRSLILLDISSSSISGVIPSAFWNQSTSLLYLNVSNNKLQGSVPNLSFPSQYMKTYFIDLSSNEFHGSIPMFFFFTAVYLDLSNNKFSSLPHFLHQQVPNNLFQVINLSNNLLSGSVPNWIFQFDSLHVLNIANNMFSGTIPESIASLWQLSALHLNNNRFSGKLPSSMKNLTQLMILELGNNNFSESVPYWIGDSLPRLCFLNLMSNHFSGELPSSLCHLQALQVLDLSDNKISGTIPACIYNFTSMALYEGFNLTYTGVGNMYAGDRDGYQGYLDYASIMWKGILANISSKNLPQWNVIDLSGNHLTGEIPTTVSSLKYLRSLDLSNNNISGSIPNEIGELKYMEVLDLSSNRLWGEIPESLADLTFLNKLNLSSNNISGRIPASTQLQSFEASSYDGNPKLCGKPLLTKCPGDVQTQTPTARDHTKEEEEVNASFDLEAFCAALAAGFALGFLGIVGIFGLHTPSRYALFRLGNKFLTGSL